MRSIMNQIFYLIRKRVMTLEKTEKKDKIINIFFTLSIVLLIFTAFFVILAEFSLRSAKSDLVDIEFEAVEMSSMLESAGVSISEFTGTGNVSESRFQSDFDLAFNYFRPAFSWRNGKEYDESRAFYLNDMDADSRFLSVFMPENTRVYNPEAGININFIDMEKLNSNFESFTQYLISESDNTRTYLVVVRISSMSTVSSRTGRASGNAFLKYSIDGERRIYNIDGWIEIYSG